MKAYVFPGQGAQFPGMAKDLFENYDLAKKRFEQANEILGFSITDVMFGDDPEALKQTQVTQPAIFLHATILSEVMGDRFQPEMVSGHSLGEFSALVAAGGLNFEDGLKYKGQFKKNLKHGLGSVSHDNEIIHGYFENDELIKKISDYEVSDEDREYTYY